MNTGPDRGSRKFEVVGAEPELRGHESNSPGKAAHSAFRCGARARSTRPWRSGRASSYRSELGEPARMANPEISTGRRADLLSRRVRRSDSLLSNRLHRVQPRRTNR